MVGGSKDPPNDKLEIGQNYGFIANLINSRLRSDELRAVLTSGATGNIEQFIDRCTDILFKITTLLDVSRRASDSLSLDILLPRMVTMISELLEADRCSVFLYDRENDELYSREAAGDLVGKIRVPANSGIVGAVFMQGQAEIISDAYGDNRFNRDIDLKTGYRTRNILCVPIETLRGDVIGVTQVLNKHSGTFDQNDLHFLQVITSQAATSLVNAQLHEQIEQARLEEVQMLEMTAAISQEMTIGPLLQKIMANVTSILNADRGALFMHDAKTNELWSKILQNNSVAEIRFPSNKGIAGSVFKTGNTINIQDAYSDPRFNQAVDKKTGYTTRSVLAVPIIAKDSRIVGVIQLINRPGGPFTKKDEKRLQAFAAQIALALENAALFTEVVNVKNYNECILESLSNGVITLNEDGVIVKINHAALWLFRAEHNPQYVIGKHRDAFFYGKNRWVSEAIETLEQCHAADSFFDCVFWLRQDDGPIVPDPAGFEKQQQPMSKDQQTGLARLIDRRRKTANINLSLVPLINTGEQTPLGCMLVLEDITTEKRLQGTMSRYMPKTVVDKLLEEGAQALGGKLQNATVLFADIRKFTTISESIGAHKTVQLLNEYFAFIVDVIFKHQGILDKYIGDAIMAVFGVPSGTSEDADNAVIAAIDMLRSLKQFNQKRVADKHALIKIGVGINTDDVVSGNIGCDRRMDYTVIGDGVNVASRLESANKYYGTQILISDSTRAALTGNYIIREIDWILVRGKTKPLAIFEVMDHHDNTDYPDLQQALNLHHRGLSYYREQNWQEARRLFQTVQQINPADNVATRYLERCAYYTDNPPAKNWDGAWVMPTK